jgi:hypothetical protein
MKKAIKYTFLFCILLFIGDCKKYEEGGITKLSRKHLFGERKDGASKIWKLKLYEVNGIDSTQLIPGASQISNFYEEFITFTLDNREGFTFKANTALYDYGGTIDQVYKNVAISYGHFPLNNLDSSQCNYRGSSLICSRSILLPEGFYSNKLWKIDKLTKKEFIITNNELKNSYKIIFECN